MSNYRVTATNYDTLGAPVQDVSYVQASRFSITNGDYNGSASFFIDEELVAVFRSWSSIVRVTPDEVEYSPDQQASGEAE